MKFSSEDIFGALVIAGALWVAIFFGQVIGEAFRCLSYYFFSM